MESKETIINGWLWESFYFGNAAYPSDSAWRSRKDQYQIKTGSITCSSVESGRVLWEYYKKPGMVDPFVTRIGDKYSLSWWEDYPETSYERDRNQAMSNGSNTYPYRFETHIL